MNNCQGTYFDIDADGGVTLWAVGNGPKGTGIYRLGDEDGDGAYEKVLHHVPTGGMGEHGPHSICRGPDGQLYFDTGNHAHLGIAADPKSPVNEAFRYEGELLPHYNDARGHAAGVMAPGGEILRSDDDGKTWSRVAAGFRNQYDFAFNRMGEIFTFDSDMEWDVGLPWYRPVRVCFVPQGAEFGWRNGSGKWPSYYFDSLPAILDVGRGSPTGVTFYQGRAFPEEYQDAFLYCDWSQGRILAARLTQEGAAYRASQTDLVVGQPLNVTDIEVGPDGAVYFTTGGRGTPGGLFRVSWDRAKTPVHHADDPAVDRAIDIASPQMAYARAEIVRLKREAGEDWALGLEEVARDGDQPAERRRRALELMTRIGPRPTDELLIDLSKSHESELRARAAFLMGMRATPLVRDAVSTLLNDVDPLVRRRACEALVRSGAEVPEERVLRLLTQRDRWLRYAARVAAEHGSPGRYWDALLGLDEPRAELEALLALVRAIRLDDESQDDLLQRELGLWNRELGPVGHVDLLRLIGLTYLLGPQKPDQVVLSGEFRVRLLSRFRDEVEHLGRPSKEGPESDRVPLLRELARLLAYLDEPRAIPLMLDAQALLKDDRATQIHFAYCLRAMPDGWDRLSKRRLWMWYETASRWDGGLSFLGYLDFMVQELVARLSPEEQAAYLKDALRYPFPSRVLVRSVEAKDAGQVEGLVKLLKSIEPGKSKDPRAAGELLGEVVEALARGGSPEAREALRSLAEADPARLGLVVRGLSAHPASEDAPLFLSALRTSGDGNTLNAALSALSRLETVPKDAETLRLVLKASRRVGPVGRKALDALGSKMTGIKPPGADVGFDDRLAFWERRYSETFPGAPPLKAADEAEHHYTLPQLVSEVVRSGLVGKASPERGRRVLDRAKCLDCHKFGDQGTGLGPDLTTLSSRFRPEEVLESVLEPSKVISDQYKPVTVATSSGQVYNGMPAGGDEKVLALLLSDGSRVNVPRGEIDEQAESKISVMPAGLIDGLSLQEIADLLALFEAQPRVELPKQGP
jgi:putative heme-binding domain-containing protein